MRFVPFVPFVIPVGRGSPGLALSGLSELCGEIPFYTGPDLLQDPRISLSLRHLVILHRRRHEGIDAPF